MELLEAAYMRARKMDQLCNSLFAQRKHVCYNIFPASVVLAIAIYQKSQNSRVDLQQENVNIENQTFGDEIQFAIEYERTTYLRTAEVIAQNCIGCSSVKCI